MRKRVLTALLLCASISCSTFLVAQISEPVQKAVSRPEIKAAMASFDSRRPQVLELWKRLALTNAPSGHEDERAAIIMDELHKLGYNYAYRDAAGNLISAPIPPGSKLVAFVAHMDTVVQPGVKIAITEGKNEKGKLTWTGPGVGDDTSGVVALLEVIRALQQAKFQPARPLIFVFSVNEEGGGTSEGIRRFIADHKLEIAAFISTDGSPIDELGGIADNGVGGYSLKPVFTGPGVHTVESSGTPSTIRAAALAIERLYKMRVPQKPLEKRSWMNIGTHRAQRHGEDHFL
jgi:tripeptide aminopeptidase